MPQLSIDNTPNEFREIIKNIAKNKGVPMSQMMRMHIRQMVESYPLEMKQDNPKGKGEMKICGVPAVVKKALISIANNLGVDYSQLVKVYMFSIIISYPEQMREFKEID